MYVFTEGRGQPVSSGVQPLGWGKDRNLNQQGLEKGRQYPLDTGIKKQGFWHRDPRRGQFVTMVGPQSWDNHRNWVVRTGRKTKVVLAKKMFRVSDNWARALRSVRIKRPELWGEDDHQRLRTWWSLSVIWDDTGAWTQLPLHHQIGATLTVEWNVFHDPW